MGMVKYAVRLLLTVSFFVLTSVRDGATNVQNMIEMLASVSALSHTRELNVDCVDSKNLIVNMDLN